MGREDDARLKTAKRGFKEASAEGNREEEARWANVIGDILKNRGEYVEALRWLRVDYDLSVRYLPQKQLLPTCQSLGEVYLRLDRFKEALVYQKKHLQLAKESDDLIEQQRASTQLGRTYHEIFLRSEQDHYAVRTAKKYFKLSMKLARTLKENNSGPRSSLFLKEFIGAHNNLGMLELDLDNSEEAERILLKTLKICDEEEVPENDDGRSRLHHNLGSVYLELREWDKARKHIERDIIICKRIGHHQGEAKGFINLGELHYRVQKLDDATKCYQKALDIARSMEDEDTLVDQITENIKTLKEAAQVLEEINIEEQKLKKLVRTTCSERGTPHERRYLLEQNTSLDSLIEKSRMIFAWRKHQEFAKRKKKVAIELCDKEKLSDSFLIIGESYQKLRNFSKARKWYMKSWNGYRSIGSLEGQALAKINVGEVLDSCGDWAGALEAFEEGYRIAVEGKLSSVQLAALNNMHYSHMIRFDNVEDARNLQNEIQILRQLQNDKGESQSPENEYCSETETEGLDMSDSDSSGSDLSETHRMNDHSPNSKNNIDDDVPIDVPLASLISSRNASKRKKLRDLKSHGMRTSSHSILADSSTKGISETSSHQSIGRKRVRVVISDDDEVDEHTTVGKARGRPRENSREDVATSNGDGRIYDLSGPSNVVEEAATSLHTSKDILSTCQPIHLEKSSSMGSRCLRVSIEKAPDFGSLSDAEDGYTSKSVASVSRMGPLLADHGDDNEKPNTNLVARITDGLSFHTITVKVGSELIHVNAHSCVENFMVNAECLKVEVACLYYLQHLKEKKSNGLLPVFQKFIFCGKDLESSGLGSYDGSAFQTNCIEAVISEWVPKRLMKLYLDSCKKKLEEPNLKLLKRLYNIEISEDEIVVSDCGLQDVSASSFIDALQKHKTIALLDLSHNILGNETMEKLQQMFISSNQTYGSLTLDLHCNRLGPTSLFHICECPILLARLEVLNLSGNRLTDACSSYLSTILKNGKALYSLSIEQCSITSRTIQKIADVLDEELALSHLNIGKNAPISGNSLVSLLVKLSKLKRFSELNLGGIKLNRHAVDSLCHLARSSNLSILILAETSIGTSGVMQVVESLSSGSQEMERLDLSYCGLVIHDFSKLCADITLMEGLLNLNLGGNSIGKEACCLMGQLLVRPQCSLRVLALSKCQLGIVGIVQIIQALEGNCSLEELYVADNADVATEASLAYDVAAEEATTISSGQLGPCELNSNYDNMEVADSEDEVAKVEPDLSASYTSSSRRNSSAGPAIIQQLSDAIAEARQLRLLDLSRNGLSLEAVEALYNSWSLRDRLSAQKHVKDHTVHFSLEDRRCCAPKECCRRDGAV